MLGEGVILYVLLVKVFGNLADKWYLLIPACWGKSKLELLLFLPYQSCYLPIVAISAGIRHEYYLADSVNESKK